MPNMNTTIALEYPFPEERVFRYQAMQDFLSRLVDEPYEEFSVSELVRRIDASQAPVSKTNKYDARDRIIPVNVRSRCQRGRCPRFIEEVDEASAAPSKRSVRST